MAFSYPLLSSEASPYPSGCRISTAQGYKHKPCLSCAHCTAGLTHPPLRPFSALYFFWSGISLSLSLILCPGLQLPGYLLQINPIDLGAHKGFLSETTAHSDSLKALS